MTDPVRCDCCDALLPDHRDGDIARCEFCEEHYYDDHDEPNV